MELDKRGRTTKNDHRRIYSLWANSAATAGAFGIRINVTYNVYSLANALIYAYSETKRKLQPAEYERANDRRTRG
jgi:hypothetical protein